MREIVLDTETTGLSPKNGDKIIEIACTEIIDGKTTGNSYQVYINPLRSISEEAQKIHGITEESLKDKPIFKEIVDGFLDFIGQDTLVIHNADFDMKFINHELSLVGKEAISFNRVIDTLAIARKKYPGQSNSLDALCDRLSIDRSKRNVHGALIDVELLADVYLELTKKDATNLMFEQKTSSSISSYNKEIKQERFFEIPKSEQENHEEFLKKIKNPMWLNN